MITELITVNQRKNNTLKTLLILKGIERVSQSWQRESKTRHALNPLFYWAF